MSINGEPDEDIIRTFRKGRVRRHGNRVRPHCWANCGCYHRRRHSQSAPISPIHSPTSARALGGCVSRSTSGPELGGALSLGSPAIATLLVLRVFSFWCRNERSLTLTPLGQTLWPAPVERAGAVPASGTAPLKSFAASRPPLPRLRQIQAIEMAFATLKANVETILRPPDDASDRKPSSDGWP